MSVQLRCCATLAFVAVALFFGGTAPALAEAPTPPEIQALLDKVHAGSALTPGEQATLRAWSTSHLLQSDPNYRPGAPPSDDAQATGIPDDIRQIIVRAEQGEQTSAAEQTRLKSWAAALNAHKADNLQWILRVGSILRGTVPDPGAAAHAPSGPADKRVLGEVRLDVTQHRKGIVRDGSGEMNISGKITIPCVFLVAENRPSTQPGAHALSIRFEIDHDRMPTGQLVSHVSSTSRERSEDATTTTMIQRGAGLADNIFGGELFFDPALPRPYIRTLQNLSGQSSAVATTTTHTDKGDRHDTTHGTSRAAAALLDPSLDAMRMDLPWATGTFATNDAPAAVAGSRWGTTGAMRQLPPAIRAAVEGTSFSIDAAAIRDHLRAGRNFEVSGTIKYQLDLDVGGTHNVDESTVTFTFAIAPPPGNLYIAPVDEEKWKSWIPDRPWLTDADDAKIFGLQPKSLDGALELFVSYPGDATKCKLQIDLADVKDLAGLSSNYPVHAAQKKSLRIAPDQTGLDVLDEGQRAVTHDRVSTIAFKVVPTTPGGWGKVTAKCTEDGTEARRKANDRTSVELPRDDDNNHIADAYQDAHDGFAGDANGDDDAQPTGQASDGDGLSRYEEYRGFIVRKFTSGAEKKWVQTDPKTKDLFVFDPDFLVKEHYETHGNPIGATLHYVDKTMMNWSASYDTNWDRPGDADHRWLNTNTPADLMAHRQYVIVVVEDETMPNGWAGVTYPDDDEIAANHALYPLCVKHAMKCRNSAHISIVKQRATLHRWVEHFMNAVEHSNENIYLIAKQRLTPAVVDAWIESEIDATVIHEIGHTVGAEHHGPQSHLGAHGCAMRYPQGQEDILEMLLHTAPLRVGYCHDGDEGNVADATWPNPAPSAFFFSPTPTVGPSHDDCWHHININSER